MAKTKKKAASSLAKREQREKKKQDQKVNPFEIRTEKRNFEAVGQKRKLTHVAQARDRATEKRRKTLGVEYGKAGKAGAFLDKRFGERDSTLTEEEKMLTRLQKEKVNRFSKKSQLYNLDDDEDLTHMGQSLGVSSNPHDKVVEDDFDRMFGDDEGLFDDNDEQDNAARMEKFKKKVEEATSGENLPQHKTLKEIYQDIILKSKIHKMEKQKEKEENTEAIDKLDAQYKDVFAGFLSKNKKPSKKSVDTMLITGLAKENNNSLPVPAEAKPPLIQSKSTADDYDKLVNELIFETRAKATDRMKTDEEIAKEEADRLMKLEKERQKRMKGEVGDDDEAKKNKHTHITGDDLHDYILNEDEVRAYENLDENEIKKYHEKQEIGGDDSDSDDYQEADGEKADSDVSDSEEENESENEDSEEGEDDKSDDESGNENQLDKKMKEVIDSEAAKEKEMSANPKLSDEEKQRIIEQAKQEIPYFLEAPKSLPEWLNLIQLREDSVPTFIQRIVASNHWKLKAENKDKMKTFYAVLLDYFVHLCSEEKLDFARIDVLSQNIFDLSQNMPRTAHETAQKHLLKIQFELENGKAKKKDLSFITDLSTRTVSYDNISKSSLLLLKLFCNIFPTSDFRHMITTPLQIYISNALDSCEINSLGHLAKGLFLSSLLLHIFRETKRYCGEAICFLSNAFYLLHTSNGETQNITFPPTTPRIKSNLSLSLDSSSKGKGKGKEKAQQLGFNEIFSSASTQFDGSLQFKLNLLNGFYTVTKKFAALYCGLDSFPEVFEPISEILNFVKSSNIHPSLREIHFEVLEKLAAITNKVISTRKPIAFERAKVTAIKTFNPKFQERFNGRIKDPDTERSQRAKLKKEHKREMKSAAKELRLDNQFLERERLKRQEVEDEQRNKKYKEAMQLLESQENMVKTIGRDTRRKKK